MKKQLLTHLRLKDLGGFFNPPTYREIPRVLVGGVAQSLERRSMTGKLSPCHAVDGDLLRVNRPLYVSQHGQLSHLFCWRR